MLTVGGNAKNACYQNYFHTLKKLLNVCKDFQYISFRRI